jgi:phosphatidylinositol glycan class A protein
MLNPTKSNVIPNGVDFTKFKPDPELQKKKNSNEITIISVSRQAYRKGTDLLIEIIPEVCKLFPNVKFVIGGDGPKKPLLENMIETSNLQDRVRLTGALRHNKVRDIMIKGNIYLNTSLTESFCIAIVEAASTGLYTIATDVGGVGEVLPDNMVKLVNADKDSIIKGIKESIETYENIKNNTNEFNAVLKDAYNWDKVAHKTVEVYNKAMVVKDRSVITRLKKLLAIGRISGVFQVCLIVLDYLLLIFLTLYQPVWTIKKGKQFKYENYQKYLRNMK